MRAGKRGHTSQKLMVHSDVHARDVQVVPPLSAVHTRPTAVWIAPDCWFASDSDVGKLRGLIHHEAFTILQLQLSNKIHQPTLADTRLISLIQTAEASLAEL